jgi:hypothetical protein
VGVCGTKTRTAALSVRAASGHAQTVLPISENDVRIMKGGIRLDRYISKIQSRRQFAGGTFPAAARLGMLTPPTS